MENPDDRLNRRTFLKQFVLLSSAPLLIQSLSGCPSSDSDSASPVVVYGPPPIDNTSPEVDGMYIHEPQSGNGDLDDHTEVPVDAAFEVEFTKEMDPAAVDSIHLRSAEDSLTIVIGITWPMPQIALITPAALLKHGSQYELFVDETARDADGNTIVLTQRASALFTTA